MVESESHDEAVEKLLKESLPFSFPLYENFLFFILRVINFCGKLIQQLININATIITYLYGNKYHKLILKLYSSKLIIELYNVSIYRTKQNYMSDSRN